LSKVSLTLIRKAARRAHCQRSVDPNQDGCSTVAPTLACLASSSADVVNFTVQLMVKVQFNPYQDSCSTSVLRMHSQQL
jgi:hypothetical protein